MNMKKHYSLPLLQGACFLLISLLLQSCGGSHNLPIEGEEELTTIELEEQGRRKRARIEGLDQEHSLINQEQKSSTLPTIMPELWQEIFSYLDFEGVLAARSVSADWNKLITGYREAGIVGVKNKPFHIIDARSWVKREKINFRDNKLGELTPATIPSFAFYHLMGHVKNIPQRFWPYLDGTQMHTLHLGSNQIRVAGAQELARALPDTQIRILYLGYNYIGNAGASELAKTLSATRVHTLNLGYNYIGDAGAIELAKALPATRVHTLNLRDNQVGDAGAIKLAKALPDTQVHTLNLGWNQIGDAGAIELAEALPATHVHTLYLDCNRIEDAGAIELAKALPQAQVHTLDLGGNQIGAAGASELAKALIGTQVHTLNLWGNQIGRATQQLLVKQYPHIKWKF
jgi:Ran GTPase-activating protein (RanGAP) involved in mRNA processing and transport